MMEAALDILSWIALVTGGFFYLVGGIGLMRMPDVFTRMHAVSVSETLGIGLIFLGMVLQAGLTLVAVKLILIFLILMVVAPVSTHALARAALHDGLRPLLANSKGWLVRTDCVELFPELGGRLRQPLSSEQVEMDGEGTSLTPDDGDRYALEDRTAIPQVDQNAAGGAGRNGDRR